MGELPFDMPKLKRRMRPASAGGINLVLPVNISINSNNAFETSGNVSQGSSSMSMQHDDRPIGELSKCAKSAGNTYIVYFLNENR